ncbi:putative Ig domain-containing protein, partial [Larkinella arboricola]
GSLAPSVTTRQVTGLLVTGTATNPILYVSSSDSRMGGPEGDLNLDTNSGIVSKLTKTPTGWQKVDLVRGLPRSEENHATNGLQLDGNKLYLVVGGHTNAGSPSTNFAYTPEYALAACVLSIDLAVIEALPTRGSGNTAYKYDLPTLDDPDRAGNPDANDPFGGNDGLNQAKLVAGGPVQVFATGFRNAFDLVITKARKMYVTDNGANPGWGGHPASEGVGTATNNYVTGEPGSTGSGPNDPKVNNLDNFHYVGDLNNYIPGSFYGGHPHPIRANPAGAGLYTHNGTSGVWRTSTSGPNPLPSDWPPVPVSMAHPIEGDFQNPGEKDNALLTYTVSTNGITEYTASSFNNTLKGHLLLASFDGTVQKITLNASGTGVTNSLGAKKKNLDLPFASNFGSQPLDITAQGDNDIFPGTVWVVCYLQSQIYVFEPQNSGGGGECVAAYSTAFDDDGDGYSNADEIDNASNPCSASSRPSDADGDKVSDLNDPDDDNDSLADDADYFPLDASNGMTTTLPINYELFNNDPGTGLFGLGFTGLMLPKVTGIDYLDLFDDQNLVAGGAVGAFSVVDATAGDPHQAVNTQENGFQFGINTNSTPGPFRVQTRLLGPFFNNRTPQYHQSQGLYIGVGDQDNYLKIALAADGGMGGIEVTYENNGVATSNTYSLPGGLPMGTLDVYLSVDKVTGLVQPRYAKDGGALVNLGPPIAVGGLLRESLQGIRALAVGLVCTSLNSTSFTATWDFIRVTPETVNTSPVLSVIGSKTATVGQPLTFTAQATDSDSPAQTLTYSIVGPASATINASSGLFSWTPTTTGTFSLTVTVMDNGSPALTAQEVILVTVNPSSPNSPPIVASALPDHKATVGTGFSCQVSSTAFSDPDGDTLTFSASLEDNSALPGWLSFDSNSRTFNGTPSGAASLTVKVTANDGKGGTISDSFVITITIGNWQTILPTSGQPTARQEAAYVQAGDRFVLLGGRGIKPVQLYNPVTRSWTNAAPTPIEMHHFQGVTLEGLIYVIGALTGNYPTEPFIPHIYIYDPNANQWFQGPEIPVARRRGTAALAAYNNKLYLAGGNTKGHDNGYVAWFDEYDPATNTWRILPDAPHARDHFQAAVIGDKFYAAGGRRTSHNTGQTFMLTVAEVDIYNFTTGQWSTTADPIPTQRAGTTTVVLDGEIVVIGGESNRPAAHGETEALNPTTGKWQRFADLQQARQATQAIVNNGGIYIVAGSGAQGGSPVLSSQEAFFKAGATTPTGTPLTQSQLSAPPTVNVGTAVIATTQSSSFTLTNTTGNQALLITNIALSGSNEFTFQSPFPLPFVLPVGQQVVLNIGFKPVTVGSKTATLTLTHSGSGGSTSIALSGQAVGANTAPVLSAIGSKTATVGQPLSFTAQATDSDVPAQTLTYSVTGAGGASINASSGAFSWTPTTTGTYSLTVKVTDSGTPALVAQEVMGVTVLPAPVVPQSVVSLSLMNADNDQEIKLLTPGEVLNLASLPTKNLNIRANTNPVTVGSVKMVLSGKQSRTQTETGAPYALFGDTNGDYKPWIPALGSYSLTVTPYTGAGAAGTAGTPLTINFSVVSQAPSANRPPVLAKALVDQKAPVGSGFTYSFDAASFTDPDGDALTYTASLATNAALPAWLSFTASTRSFSGTPPGGSPASLTVQVTASDGKGGSVSGSFVLTITTPVVNTAPVLSSIGSKTVTVGQPLSFTAQATDSDVPAQTLTYSVTGAGGASINASSGAFSWTPTTTGTYSLTVKVTDSGTPALVAQEVMGVTVLPAPVVPQSVVSLSLMNADNDQEIKLLTPGEVLNLASLPTKNLNIRANTNPVTVGSVKMVLSGKQSRTQTETGAPYALFGDTNGDYKPWIPALGSYSLTVTPYTGAGAAGTAGTPLTINFSVVNQAPAARLTVQQSPESADNVLPVVYPNPFQSSFTLETGRQGLLPVVLYDGMGRKVFELKDVESRQLIKPGPDLAPGLYLLEVGEGLRIQRRKLLKVP